jgi:cbb3-type cytochrome oxidase maturation protein
MTPILLFLFALTLLFVGLAAVGIMWAIRSGQFDDLEGPAQRILMDDDDPLIPFNQPPSGQKQAPVTGLDTTTKSN